MSQNDETFIEYEIVCKDTGETFRVSVDAILGDQLRGLSAPSRSSSARRSRVAYLKAFPIAFAPDRRRPIPAFENRWGDSYGLGIHQADIPPPKKIPYGGKLCPEMVEKFAGIAPFVEAITAEFNRPNGRRVAILSTPTGSGKSTWLPYALRMSPLGRLGRILITQPRLVTLRKPEEKGFDQTLPGYIAKNLMGLDGIGAGREIGVLHRGESQMHDRYTKLLFVSDGILKAWLADGISAQVGRFHVIVVDEAHELSTNMEFVFMMLRIALQRFPHLRLVIASATMDERKFVYYFGGEENVLVAKPDSSIARTTHKIVDHWPDGDEGFARMLPDFRPITSTRNIERIPELVKSVVSAIRSQPNFSVLGGLSGDILVFVPTIFLVNATKNKLAELGPDVRPVPCHAQLSPDEETEFYEARGAAECAEKTGKKLPYQIVYVATNYAETSITLPRLTFVIDSGLIAEPRWIPHTSSRDAGPRFHTKSGCTQRKGRVGRHLDGEVYRLYSSEIYEAEFPDFSEPEIFREPLDRFLLDAVAAGVRIKEVRLLSGVPKAEMMRATKNLVKREVLGAEGFISDKGRVLRALQTSSVDTAQFLDESDLLACELETATFLAFTSGNFRLFLEGAKGEQGYLQIRSGCMDDLDFYLRIFHHWESAGPLETGKRRRHKERSAREKWCEDFGLNHGALLKVSNAREKLLRELGKKTHTALTSRLVNVERLVRVRVALARAVPEWIYVVDSHAIENSGVMRFMPLDSAACPYKGEIGISRDSCAIGSKDLRAFVCLDRQLVAGQVTAKHVVAIDPEWTPHLQVKHPAGLSRFLRQLANGGFTGGGSNLRGGRHIVLARPETISLDALLKEKGKLLSWRTLRPAPAEDSSHGLVAVELLNMDGEANSAGPQSVALVAKCLDFKPMLHVQFEAEIMAIDMLNSVVHLSQRALIGKYTPGSEVQGVVVSSASAKGLVLGLEGGIRAYMRPSAAGPSRSHLDWFQPGDSIRVRVVENKRHDVSIEPIQCQLAVGEVLTGRVVREMERGVFVMLKPFVDGYLPDSQLSPALLKGQAVLGAQIRIRIAEVKKDGNRERYTLAAAI